MAFARSLVLYLCLIIVALMGGGFGPALAQEASAAASAASGLEGWRSGYSPSEAAIIDEVLAIRNSPSFADFQRAFKDKKAMERKIAGRTILVEPGAPFSGFTLMGENGFVLGSEAFASEAELTKTLLHEIYRLEHSLAKAQGVSGERAAFETRSAFEFSEKAYKDMEKIGFRR